MNKKRLQFFFGLMLVIAFLVWISAFSSADSTENKLHIYFLDVGQGDSIYIKNPDGSDILIDGGPDSKVLQELGEVMNLGDRKIDLVVLTHPHADHLSGLIEVINRYEIGEVWETGVEHSSSTYDQWKAKIKEKGIADKFVSVNEQKTFGEIKFFVLYPLSQIKNQNIDNLNNASIISELNYNKFSTLFLSDAEISAQAQILKSIKPTTVVKVGHHGSENAQNKDLYNILRPALAVISVGKDNTYGHPSNQALNFLKSLATQIYRTDQDGRIEIESDGQNYKVKLRSWSF